MYLRRTKTGLAALLPLGAFVTACPGVIDDGVNQNARASIVVRFPGGSNQVPSDGVTALRVSLTARDKDGQPDNSAITIEPDDGLLALDGGDPDTGTLTGTPEAGVLELDYVCEAWASGPVKLAVSNESASATVIVSCVQPEGEPVIQVTGPQDGEVRNGAPVDLVVSVRNVAGAPASGDEVLVRVDGGDGDAVLRTGDDTGTNVTLTLDADGQASVQFDAPVDLEDTDYTVTVGYRPFPTVPFTEEVVTLTNAFRDGSNVEMRIDGSAAPGSGTVRGGAPATVVLEVLDVDGQPAAGEDVELAVDGPGIATLVAGADSGDSVIVTLDEAGMATFVIDPPARLDETSLYTVTASYEFLDGAPARTATFELTNLFQDDSDVAVTGLTSIEGGTSAPLVITVLDAAGLPAAGSTINVSITGGLGGATITSGPATGAAVVATLGEAGQATVTVNAPSTPAPAEYTLTVNYEVFPGLLASQTAIPITVTEPGGLTLNLETQALRVRSDIPGERAADVRVTLRRGMAVPAGAQVTLRIADVDVSRAKFSPRPGQTDTEVTLTAASFNVQGEATVGFEALPNVPSATVTITATGSDSDPATTNATATLEVEIFRAPILQSMVALAPNPAIIGVRGGSDPSSSIIAFQLLDDANQPMEGVPVTFSTNATADRGVSVTAFGVSDASGQVQTILSAGTVAGPVSVIATATPRSPDPAIVQPTLTVQSPPVAITGGLPNFVASFMSCDQAVTRQEGNTLGCQLTLVDRFTNLVDGQVAQFRAEGSGTNATATSGGGVVNVNLVLDDGDTFSGASLPQWSHGFVPTPATTIAGFTGCTDDTVTTGCNIIGLCSSTTAAVNQYCPLEPSCLADAVVARDRLLGSPTGTSVVLTFPATGVGANTSTNLQTYIDTHASCGFPVSCLTGTIAHRDGVAEIPGDECPVAAGCMDFSPDTPCPQDGLLTVVATTRGEESFADENGNGIYDEGESHIDLPEPFLDKNESCSFDEYGDAARFQFSITERIRHTDLFADVNGDGEFGYGVDQATGRIRQGNGVYDDDTETFFAAKALLIDPVYSIVLGASCEAGTAGCIENVYGRDGFHQNPDGKTGINPAALDRTLSGTIDPASGQSTEVFVRVGDRNGNCKSEGFAATVAATVISGPVEVTPVSLNMDEFECGMSTRTNLLRPHCEEALDLGAPTGSFSVKAACATEGTETAEVGVAVDGEPPVILTFTVTCS